MRAGVAMTPCRDRSPRQRAREWLARFLTALCGLLVALAFVAGLAGCPRPAREPVARYMARGAVLAVANAVDILDDGCAQKGRAMFQAGDTVGAVTLLKKCATAYKAARDALIEAAYAVDEWGQAEKNGKAVCALGAGVHGMNAIVAAMRAAGVEKWPPELSDALAAAEYVTASVGGQCAIGATP